MNSFQVTRWASQRWLPAMLVAIAAGIAAPATAQSTQGTEPAFAELAGRVRDGDTVAVTGPTVGRVRGRFVDLSADALTVATDAGPRTIAASDIDRVTRRRRGIVLGTIIGLGVGIGFAIPLNMLFDNEGGNRVGPTAFVMGTSTAVGLGIDALIDLPRTVYRRSDRLKVRLAPQIAPRGAGLAMHVAF